MLGDDINTAATSCRSPPLPQVPNVPHQLPTMPHFASQHSTQASSQQESAQRLQDCGFRTGLSHGSASSSSSSEQSTPPKLVPIFTKRRPSRQASLALLRLRRQKELLPGASGETSHLTPRTFPAHHLVRAPPGQPRLWAPPAAKFRCPLKTTTEQSSEAISKHRTSSDSSSQVSLSHLLHRWIQTEPHSPFPHTPAAQAVPHPVSRPDLLLLCSRSHLQVQMWREEPGQENLLFLSSSPESRGRVLETGRS